MYTPPIVNTPQEAYNEITKIQVRPPGRKECTMESGIEFNPHDLKGMCDLMDKYGSSETMFPGENEVGERVHISIFPDKIVVSTFQTNDWIRKNTYYRDGSRDETFEK